MGKKGLSLWGKDRDPAGPQHHTRPAESGGGVGGGMQTTGMKRKWERHFPHGRWLLLGQCLFLQGVTLLLFSGVLWAQLFLPTVLESKVAFEAVIDKQDEWEGSNSFLEWKGPSSLGGESQMSLYHVWHVNNPADVILAGFKPQIEDRGPYGYLPRETKYNISFEASPGGDSETVTYRKWKWLEGISSPQDCEDLYFNMGIAALRLNAPDCPNQDCLCKDASEDLATVVNPPFFRLLDEEGPAGILAELSLHVFDRVHRGFTLDFVNAVRGAFLPDLVGGSFEFRRAAALSNLLQEVWNQLEDSLGTEAALASLQSADDESTLTCGAVDACPWGTSSYIAQEAVEMGLSGANATALSYDQAKGILGLVTSPTGGSVLVADELSDMSLWVSAGRHLGLLDAGVETIVRRSAPYASSYQAAYNNLVALMLSWGGVGADALSAEAKVRGVARWLFEAWWAEDALTDAVAQEWLSSFSFTQNPCDPISLSVCAWGSPEGDSSSLTLEAVRLLIDPAEGVPGNSISIHTANGLDNWRKSRIYCQIEPPRNCTSAEGIVDAVEGSMQSAMELAGCESGELAVCEAADWLFGTWAEGESSWVNETVAKHLNESLYASLGTGYQVSGDALEDLGYAQWGGGYVTQALYGLRSITTVMRKGLWKLVPGVDEAYHSAAPEFWSRAARAGYPHMEFASISEAREVLSLLADSSASGKAFRQHIVEKATTALDTFAPGDRLFTLENEESDFSWETLSDGASEFLTRNFVSSSEQCQVVEGVYQSCQALIDGQQSRWATSCETFQTIISDPSQGLECNEVRVGNYPHPRYKRPGSILAESIYDMTWELYLIGEGFVCSGGDGEEDCDFSRGGLFTTQKASDVLFDGYIDPLVVELLNRRYADRGLSFACSNPQPLPASQRGEKCETLFSSECWAGGFVVEHGEHGVVLQVEPQGSGRYLWHAADLELPHGLGVVRNPVFAAYPAATWENSTFHKQFQCDGRFFGGPIGDWSGCDDQQRTGRSNLEETRAYTLVRDNSTLASPDATLPLTVDGGDGWQSRPFGWNGIEEYFPLYISASGSGGLIKREGTHSGGADSLSVLDYRYLVRYDMEPVEQAAGSLDHRLRYPAPRSFEEAWEVGDSSDSVSQKVSRYWSRVEDWEDARVRGGISSLLDSNGMPYQVPHGMAALFPTAGFPVFASDPHLLSNVEYYSADQSVEYDWNQISGVEPLDSKHRSYVDVDPITGRSLRRALRTQLNLRLERSSLFPNLMGNRARVPTCDPPTKDFQPDGMGCYMYIPLLWEAEEAVMDSTLANEYKDSFWIYPDRARDVAFYGALFSLAAIGAGLSLWGLCVWRRKSFRRRKFVD